MSPRPRCREDLVFRQVAKEFLAYDPRSDHLVLLSATAAAVLALADGAHSAREIAARLESHGASTPAFEAGATTLEADVARTLAELESEGLLESDQAPGAL